MEREGYVLNSEISKLMISLSHAIVGSLTVVTRSDAISGPIRSKVVGKLAHPETLADLQVPQLECLKLIRRVVAATPPHAPCEDCTDS